MPNREDIAEWLREAEAALKDYESLLEGTGRRIASHDIQCLHEDFAERAAQVAAMRCETCKHRSYSHCSKYNQYILELKEGCFHHEAKE